jgi:hypothetical protein
MKRCERCMKTILFWQKKDIESIGNKITCYHWNCRYPKIKWWKNEMSSNIVVIYIEHLKITNQNLSMYFMIW